MLNLNWRLPRLPILQLFSESQVDTYLLKYAHHIYELSRGNHTPKTILDLIAEVYDLEDLSRRPILLKLIVDTLPLFVKQSDGRYEVELRGARESFSAITPSRLYFFYTEQELIRAAERRNATTLLDRNTKRELIQALAFRLFQRNIAVLDLSEVIETIRDRLAPPIPQLLAVAADIHSCSFMVRDSADHFVFTHKSFMEYFAATYLLELLSSPARAREVLAATKLTEEVLYFLGDLVTSVAPKHIATLRELEGQGDTTLRYNAANTLIFSRNARTQLSGWKIDALLYIKQDIPRLKLDGCEIRHFKVKRSKIIELELTNTVMSILEVIGPGVVNLVLTGGSCDIMSLVAIEHTRIRLDGVDIKAFSCCGAKIHGGLFRNCRVSVGAVKGASFQATRFESCLFTCQSETGFAEAVSFREVVCENCAFVDFTFEGKWREGCVFSKCTFVRCGLPDGADPAVFRGGRGFFLRNSRREPMQRSVYEAPFVRPGYPSIYSFEQAMKPVRYPDTIASLDQLILQTFPADGQPIKDIDLAWVEQKFVAARAAWSGLLRDRGHRAFDDFAWRTEDDLENAIQKAEKAVRGADPFEDPGKYIRFAQLRLARAWGGEPTARVADWTAAKALCDEVLHAIPTYHLAYCLKAAMAVDIVSANEPADARLKAEMKQALSICSAAIKTMPWCGIANALYCDLIVLSKGVLAPPSEVAAHRAAALGEGALSNSALVQWSETLRSRALSASGAERIALGRRSLV